jgi:excisionase family DNA binding protein
LGVGRNTLRRLIDDGMLAAVQYSAHSERVCVRRRDLDAFISDLPEGTRKRVASRGKTP